MENNEVYTYLIGSSVAPHVAAAFVEETEMSSLNVTRYTLVHMSRNSMEDIEIWLQKADTKFNALKTAHKMTLTTAFHRLRHSLPDANPPASLTRKEPEDNDLVAPKLKKSKNKKSLKKGKKEIQGWSEAVESFKLDFGAVWATNTQRTRMQLEQLHEATHCTIAVLQAYPTKLKKQRTGAGSLLGLN
jgi:chromatin remodeling complex protein RSC6